MSLATHPVLQLVAGCPHHFGLSLSVSSALHPLLIWCYINSVIITINAIRSSNIICINYATTAMRKLAQLNTTCSHKQENHMITFGANRLITTAVQTCHLT